MEVEKNRKEMVEMMHKPIAAILLSALLLFTVPTSGEGHATANPPAAERPSDNHPKTEQAPSVSPDDIPSDTTHQEVPPTPQEEPETPVRVVDPEKPMVALTFDDGPHPTNTDALLDILEQNSAVATFFQVGQNLYKDPEAMRRAEAMGCEIGSHSYRHADLSKLSADAIAADLQKADDAFIEVLGHAPTLLRPPYGAMNSAVKATTGRSIITWSIDTEDWRSRNAEKVIAAVQAAGDLNGQVILMHDVHASTIEAAETLIPSLIEQGYQLVTVSELITLHYGDQVLPNGLYGYSYFKSGKPVILPAGQTPPQVEAVSSGETPAPDSASPAQGEPSAPAGHEVPSPQERSMRP